MKNTIRTFIAIKIEPAEKLADFFRKAKKAFNDEPIKWVDTNNLHLTLRFLGETSNEQVQKIIFSLEKIASRTKGFQIKLNGVSCFKSNGNPKVIFINIDEIDKLKLLAGEIENEVRVAGFDPDKREFNPHLTLGRIKFLKNIDGFTQNLGEWKNTEFQTVRVDEIVYYQSILNDREPVYKPLGKFELK